MSLLCWPGRGTLEFFEIKCRLVETQAIKSAMSSLSAQWLQPYAPTKLLRSVDILADHVDFWEEERFCVHGKWRDRELTEFIRSGMTADRTQCIRFKQLLSEYIEMALRHPSNECKVRKKAMEVAVAEIRRWLRTPQPINTVT
jgi:hypothetical protein